jgi:hypothetical protein
MDPYSDPRNFAVPTSHLNFQQQQQQYDAWGRPIHIPPLYTYTHLQPRPPSPRPDRRPPPFSPPDQNRGGISIRGRAQRGRNKGRSQQHDNPNLIDIPPFRGSVSTEYDPSDPGLVLDNASVNVNDIPISNARNRLRSRVRSPTPEPVINAEPPHYHSPAPEVEPELGSELESEPESPPKQDRLHDLIQQMAANGAPPTPTGPAATHGHTAPRTRRLQNYVQIADAYMFQQTIDERLRKIGVTPAREDALRLAGVQWIDQTRKALKL